LLSLRIEDFYAALALARLIAYCAARLASRLAARLALAASGVAAVVDGRFSDNANMSHISLRISFVLLYFTYSQKSSDYRVILYFL
jgi:hypothetical protein